MSFDLLAEIDAGQHRRASASLSASPLWPGRVERSASGPAFGRHDDDFGVIRRRARAIGLRLTYLMQERKKGGKKGSIGEGAWRRPGRWRCPLAPSPTRSALRSHESLVTAPSPILWSVALCDCPQPQHNRGHSCRISESLSKATNLSLPLARSIRSWRRLPRMRALRRCT